MKVEHGILERQLIDVTGSHAIFIPGKMVENSVSDDPRVNLDNVFKGLQWYQASNNYYKHSLNREQRVRLVREIFHQTDDFISLARTVEIQTGVNGLISAVLQSYNWAEWRINPRLPNLTEKIFLKPHIGLDLRVGESMHAVSEVDFRIESTDGYESVEPNNIHSLDGIDVKFDFTIIRNGEDIQGIEDEHGVLPRLLLRNVKVLPGRKIKLEGCDSEEYIHGISFCEPETLYFSYILGGNGDLGFDMRTEDRREVLLKLHGDEMKEDTIFTLNDIRKIIGPDFEWKRVRQIICDDPMAEKALSYFLLPYCDMPTTDGHFYVLPEEMFVD